MAGITAAPLRLMYTQVGVAAAALCALGAIMIGSISAVAVAVTYLNSCWF
jgi:hypothetical protein